MQNGQMKGQVGNALPLPGLSGVANGPVGKYYSRLPSRGSHLSLEAVNSQFLTQATCSRVQLTTTAT